MITQDKNHETPTILERLQSGDLRRITDLPKPSGEDLAWPTQGLVPGDPTNGASARLRANTLVIDEAKRKYGEDGIVIGDAFSFEGEVPTTAEGKLGLYVTAHAYDAVHQAEPVTVGS